jgi:hypothetical protein
MFVKLVRIFVFLALLSFPAALAQGLYLGVSAATPLNSSFEDFTEAFEIGGQLGFDFIPYFGARLALEGNPFSGGLKLAGADLLARTYIPLTYHNFYAGVGADAFFLAEPSSVEELQDYNLAAHAVVGGELRLGGPSGFGFFVEAIPSYLVGLELSSPNAYYVRARAGVNYHF